MIPFFVDYASPSAFDSTRDRAELGLAADRRRPVRFHAQVKKEHRVGFRLALQALGEVVWSRDQWIDESTYAAFVLDPIITVHPDAVFFEAFSQDLSTYGQLRFDRAIFEPEGEVRCGTTNVDFTAWLHAALGEMRSSRETWLRIEPAGFEVVTRGAGGRHERKVDVPLPWIRGFSQLQAAMAMPGTRLAVRPVDLLAALRFLSVLKARISPRALRYELAPDQDAKLVLEPWEHVVPLVGAQHGYTERRVIRTWGRRRLKLLAPILPYAERVDVYLKGRALPHFYRVELPGAAFLLGLSGWSANTFATSGGLSLLSSGGHDLAEPAGTDAVRAKLEGAFHASIEALGGPAAAPALTHLVRSGRAFYDVAAREYRYRELFDAPIDLPSVFPPDPEQASGQKIVAEKRFHVSSCAPRETRKVRKLKTPDGPVVREIVHRDWQVFGKAGDQPAVEVVLNEEGRMIFGRCGCSFFTEHHLGRGPCAHLLALALGSEPLRRDLPTSVAAELPPPDVDAAEDVEDNDA